MKSNIAKVTGFTSKQSQAIELLAAGEKDVDIAKIIGVNRSSLSRWKQRSDFSKKVISRARELLRESLPQLYKIGISKAGENASYFRTVMEHIEKIESIIDPLEEITIRWKSS